MLRQFVADALFMRGMGLLQAGNAPRARWQLALAARLAASNAVYFGAAALAAFKSGEADIAVKNAERALALDPGLDSARDLLSAMFMHGEDYLRVLARLHEHLKPRTYLEIGVALGWSLSLVAPQTKVLAIDPAPQLGFEPPANLRLFKETSDDFFARHDARAELGGLPVDLAFIDGMHHFEFALRDFMNVERCSSPQSTIVLDDCFPRDRLTAQRERNSRLERRRLEAGGDPEEVPARSVGSRGRRATDRGLYRAQARSGVALLGRQSSTARRRIHGARLLLPGEGARREAQPVSERLVEDYRGSSEEPMRNSSTVRAHCRPSRIAHTTSD